MDSQSGSSVGSSIWLARLAKYAAASLNLAIGLTLWGQVKSVALMEQAVPSYVSISMQNGDHTECNTLLKSVQLRKLGGNSVSCRCALGCPRTTAFIMAVPQSLGLSFLHW